MFGKQPKLIMNERNVLQNISETNTFDDEQINDFSILYNNFVDYIKKYESIKDIIKRKQNILNEQMIQNNLLYIIEQKIKINKKELKNIKLNKNNKKQINEINKINANINGLQNIYTNIIELYYSIKFNNDSNQNICININQTKYETSINDVTKYFTYKDILGQTQLALSHDKQNISNLINEIKLQQKQLSHLNIQFSLDFFGYDA